MASTSTQKKASKRRNGSAWRVRKPLAPAKKARSKKKPGIDSNRRADLVERIRSALATELHFVPNPDFARRKPLSAEAVIAAATSDLEAGSPWPSEGRGNVSAVVPLCAAPLLRVEQVWRLFDAMNYCRYRANVIRTQLSLRYPSAKRLMEFEQFRDAASYCRQLIVSANLRLVISIVKGFVNRANTFDDLFSEGTTALMRATDSYDPNRGYRFSTYATCAIRRELTHFVQKQTRDRTRFVSGGDSEPTQVAARMEGPSDVGRHEEIFQTLMRFLHLLDERERTIILARYGFESERKTPTFERLGESLGVCKERVRQLEARALRKLRRFAAELRWDPLSL